MARWPGRDRNRNGQSWTEAEWADREEQTKRKRQRQTDGKK